MDPKRANYNIKLQIKQLESLLAKLPKLDSGGEPAPVVRPRPRRLKRLGEADVQRMAEGYVAGATVYELAAEFGVSRQRVSSVLHTAGVELRRRGLTSTQVNQAARLYADGWSLARIGNQLKVDAETVRTQLRQRGVRMREPWERR